MRSHSAASLTTLGSSAFRPCRAASTPTSTYPTCVTFLSLSQMTNRSGSSSPNVGAAATSGVVNSGALSSTDWVARSAGPDAPDPVARSCVEMTVSRLVAATVTRVTAMGTVVLLSATRRNPVGETPTSGAVFWVPVAPVAASATCVTDCANGVLNAGSTAPATTATYSGPL